MFLCKQGMLGLCKVCFYVCMVCLVGVLYACRV